MQREITTMTDLLTPDGKLAVCGWARRDLFRYDASLVARPWRLKEWDFYQVSDGKVMVQINFFNISVASAATAAVVDLTTGERADHADIRLFTKNRFRLPEVSDRPNTFAYESGKTKLSFVTGEDSRRIRFSGKCRAGRIEADLTLSFRPDDENITIVTPFKGMPDRFFLTTKHNCMPCEGSVMVGEKRFEFRPETSFGVLDWGRGVWPHRNVWYWGNGSTYIDGKRFGFEVTWKIGDESNATETCLFYDGKAHKIGAVDIEKFPGENDAWMSPWHIRSEDGRLDVTMTPFFDNKSGAIICDLGMKTHQVHGLWNGYAILDDGRRIDIKDMYAFCEYVENAW